MTQVSEEHAESIARRVKAADPEPLNVTPEDPHDPYSPLEIAEMLLEGKIPPGKVDELLLRWISENVDIPYVPDTLEDKVLIRVLQALEGIVLSIVRRNVK